MKTIKSKIIALALAVIFVISGIPVSTAFASDTQPYVKDGVYYRISGGEYVAFNTDFDDLVSYFQTKLSERETSIEYKFATTDTKYAYTYDDSEDDNDAETAEKVGDTLFDDLLYHIYTDNNIGSENSAKFGDYLQHSIISYSYGANVYNSKYDTATADGEKYYTFSITMTNVKYYSDANQENLVDSLCKQFVAEYIDDTMSEYEKVKTIYDFVVRNTDYDYDVFHGQYSTNSDRYNWAHSAFGALFGELDNTDDYDLSYKESITGEKILNEYNQGKSVCEGYSKLFYYLCTLCNIRCRIVDGDYVDDGKTDPHQWNYVYLDDNNDDVREWYQVDTTFASQKSYKNIDINNYSYFLCGTENSAFDENNHQQPYKITDGKNQIYDWYSPAYKATMYDYRMKSVSLINLSNIDFVVAREQSSDKVGEFYFVNPDGTVHQIQIGDTAQMVNSEVINGFEYNGNDDTFSIIVSYLVPDREYVIDSVVACDIGTYTIEVEGANDTTFSWDFTIIPYDMTNNKNIQVRLEDQESQVTNNNFTIQTNYTGVDFLSTMSVNITDGYGKDLQNKKDYNLVAYSDAKLKNKVDAIKDIGTYYVNIEYCGNYSGNFCIEFVVDKIDFSTLTTDQYYYYSYYPKAILEADGTSMEEYMKDAALKRRVGDIEIEQGVDYSVTVKGDTDYLSEGTIVLTGLKGSDKVVYGTKISIPYVISEQYDLSKLDGKPADSNKTNKHYYTGSKIKPTKFDNLDASIEKGVDYKIVSYGSNVNAGKGYVTIEGINGCTGKAKMYFIINAVDIADESVSLKYDAKSFSSKGGSYSLTWKGEKLVKNTDYTDSVTVNSSGKCNLTIKGEGNFTGSIKLSYKVVTPTSKGNYAKLSTTSYTYDSKAKKPTVKVYNSSKQLVDSYYYTVTYSNNTNPGKAKAVVKFRNGYSGSLTYYYTINPKKPTVTSVSGLSKAFTAKWKKDSTVTGYQVQYSTNSNFSGATTKTVSKNSTVSLKVSKLKAKKTYYVRVRSYKTVGSTKYYSAWSPSKSVKTK